MAKDRKLMKERDALVRTLCDEHGWTVTSGPVRGKGGHLKWRVKRNGQELGLTAPIQQSDHRALMNWRSQLRRTLASRE